MFSGFKKASNIIVSSFDPQARLKTLSKQVIDDASVLNQNLRDVCKHLGTQLHDRADQTLGCMIANHASRLLSTLWTVLLQMLREANNEQAQLCILKHFSHIANRINIKQRINAFRVFAKEIISICGNQNTVGDRQFGPTCTASLSALGTHSDADLSKALLEKFLSGVFLWTRSDAKRAACSICATLIFRTTNGGEFWDTLQGLLSAKRQMAGIVMLIDNCIPLMIEQAVRLCPHRDPSLYHTIQHTSKFIVDTLIKHLEEENIDATVMPQLVSSYVKLHVFAATESSVHDTTDHAIFLRDIEIRGAVMRTLRHKESMKKMLWCPIISIIDHCHLSSDPAALASEIGILEQLTLSNDSMVRCEAFIALGRAVLSLPQSALNPLVNTFMEKHAKYTLERCSVTVCGVLKLLSACFMRITLPELAADVLHQLLRSHMDLGNTLNTVPQIQIEVLHFIEHTVEHMSTGSLAYLLMCLQKGNNNVRERAIDVLIELCRKSNIEELQLFEPSLRGVDFLEGRFSPVDSECHEKVSTSHITAPSRYLQQARNLRIVVTYFHHLLVSRVSDTDKEENQTIQTVSEVIARLATEAEGLQRVFVDVGREERGSPLEHCFYTALQSIENCVLGSTPYPTDTICLLIESMSACLGVLRHTTQFDIHFHKRIFSFAWNILVLSCESVDPNAAKNASKERNLYLSLRPPHTTMAKLVTSAAQSAMTTSEQNKNAAFYRMNSAIIELLAKMLQYGHRSKLFIAHMRVQFESFVSALDIMVSAHPVEVLRCTRELIIVLLTSHASYSAVLLGPNTTADLCRKVVSSVVPVLNRSLSFDFIVVGKNLFSVFELFVAIDVAAKWTVCYRVVDDRFLLFNRLVEISIDPAHYNSVSGPYVIKHVVSCVRSILMSPHLPEALRALNIESAVPVEEKSPDEYDYHDYENYSQLYENAESTVENLLTSFFPPFNTVEKLIHDAHREMKCSVYADVLASICSWTPELTECRHKRDDISNEKLTPSERFNATMTWLNNTHDSSQLVLFLRYITRMVCTLDRNSHLSHENEEYLRGHLYACCKMLTVKINSELPIERKKVAKCLFLCYVNRYSKGESPAITLLLCAAVLHPGEYLATSLNTILKLLDIEEEKEDYEKRLTRPIADTSVMISDVQCLTDIIENSEFDVYYDECTLQHPHKVFLLQPQTNLTNATSLIACAWFTILTGLPTSVQWTCDNWGELCRGFSVSSIWQPYKLAILSIMTRQSTPVPASCFLHDASSWAVLMELHATGAGYFVVDDTEVDYDIVGEIIVNIATNLMKKGLLSDLHFFANLLRELLPNINATHVMKWSSSVSNYTTCTIYFFSLLKDAVKHNNINNININDNSADDSNAERGGAAEVGTSNELSAADELLSITRCLTFYGDALQTLPGRDSRFTVEDLTAMALVASGKAAGAHLAFVFMSVCVSRSESITSAAVVSVVSAMVRCGVSSEEVQYTAVEVTVLLTILERLLRNARATHHGETEELLALSYTTMYFVILAAPTAHGDWQHVLDGTAELDDAWLQTRPLLMSILTRVLELPTSASLERIAEYTLSIFIRASGLSQGINESILWLVVKCCRGTIWQSILSQKVCGETELVTLQFIVKMNQTVGVGPDLVMELHARYTPLLLSFGNSKELYGDEQRMNFWLMTSLLLHIIYSEERHTKPKPHMALSDSLPLYLDFNLKQMASPAIGRIRSIVDKYLFPSFFRMDVTQSERHWNIHARGQLLPILGRQSLAKTVVEKLFSSILHMYLHVVTTVFHNLSCFAPVTVSDVFTSLSVLAVGNAPLLKHSPSTEGTVASAILQQLYAWYGKHAASALSTVDKSVNVVHFGNSLFPEPSSNAVFCDTYNILACATVISSLYMKGNELLPGAVDVSIILDKMLSMNIISHQGALTSVLVMSASATRREMSKVAPILTHRILRELDSCMRGSLSFSFGIMLMLRTAFSVLSAFPDDAVTMKVCEAVWNVVVKEGSGGRRIQHYAHFMLQSIVNLHTVSETQWNILRAIVSLPQHEAVKIVSAHQTQDLELDNGGSFTGSAATLVQDSARILESGRQFLFKQLDHLIYDDTVTELQLLSNQLCMPVRNSLISAGMRKHNVFSLVEQEDNVSGAAVVYGSTANLLQITTIASFVLGSKMGGERAQEEADRNHVTVLDMLKQIDDDSSAVGDVFLIIVNILVEEVLDPKDALYVLLNRFNFSLSTLYLFNRLLSTHLSGIFTAASSMTSAPIESLLLLFIETATRRDQNECNSWWVACNVLANLAAASGGSGNFIPDIRDALTAHLPVKLLRRVARVLVRWITTHSSGAISVTTLLNVIEVCCKQRSEYRELPLLSVAQTVKRWSESPV